MFNVFAMNEFDREITIAEKAYDIAMAEAAYLEAMIDAKLRINMAKSEYKVMTESTVDAAQGDLVYLYNEAGKEAESNSEGVFTKIKNAVVSFLITVWNSIQKLFTKEDTQAYKDLKASKEKITLPMDVAFLANKGEEIANALDAQGDSKQRFGSVAKIAGLVIAVGSGIAGAKALIPKLKERVFKKTTMTKGEAVDTLDSLNNLSGRVLNSGKGVTNDPTDDGGATGTLNIFKTIGGWIGTAIGAIRKALGIASDKSSNTPPKQNTNNDAGNNSGNADTGNGPDNAESGTA